MVYFCFELNIGMYILSHKIDAQHNRCDVTTWKRFPHHWDIVREFTANRWISLSRHKWVCNAVFWCFLHMKLPSNNRWSCLWFKTLMRRYSNGWDCDTKQIHRRTYYKRYIRNWYNLDTMGTIVSLQYFNVRSGNGLVSNRRQPFCEPMIG